MSSIDGYTFEKEGFYNFSPDPIIEGNENKQKDTDENRNILNYIDSTANNNYKDIDTNIQEYNALRKKLEVDVPESEFNSIYIPDKTDLVRTTIDVRKQDVNSILLQQNYIFIVGSITCATLLIAAIVIGKGK
jgi:hypothetical protein